MTTPPRHLAAIPDPLPDDLIDTVAAGLAAQSEGGDADRERVAAFAAQLRNVGFALVPADHPGPRVPVAAVEPYLELLAHVGHLRWTQTQPGNGKSDPSLGLWSELPAAIREAKRGEVLRLIELFQAAGWRLSKSTGVIDGTPPGRPAMIGMSPEIERMAQVMHVSYLVRREEAGETDESDPSQQPWESLDKRLRMSNMLAVLFLIDRLDVVGYRMIAEDDVSEAPFDLAAYEQVVDALAQMAHARWLNERVGDGWLPAPRDPALMTHEHLKPWDEIPVSEQVKSVEQVRDLPAVLESARLRLERIPPAIPLHDSREFRIN